MKEKLISYKTAKLAKEKGFSEVLCNFVYDNKELKQSSQVFNRDGFELVPTQSLLQKWLREIHLLDINIKKDFSVYNLISITSYDGTKDVNIKQEIEEGIEWRDFSTYEEALEEALLQSLNLI